MDVKFFTENSDVLYSTALCRLLFNGTYHEIPEVKGTSFNCKDKLPAFATDQAPGLWSASAETCVQHRAADTAPSQNPHSSLPRLPACVRGESQ